MDEDQKLLELMKLRILRSFKWRDDVVNLLAKELKISVEEFEKILMNKLDMSSLEALHATFESARPNCLNERLHSDLRLCWLSDVMGLISNKDADVLKIRLVKEIINGKRYDEALEEGKAQVLILLKRK